MITDSLTTATIITVIVISLILFAIMIYSHFTMKKDMKMFARCYTLLHTDDEVGDLCKKIAEIEPNSCPILDKDISMTGNDPERLKAVLKLHLKKLKQVKGIKL